jgi:hypothetical protein
MSRLEWWFLAVLFVGAVLAHPLLPRYAFEIKQPSARRQLLSPVGDNYFCRRRVSKGESPTTRRPSVVVVGRSVAVKDVSAGAPAGA